MRHDLLADVLSVIKNAERAGKKECTVKASKLVQSVLRILQANGYIGVFELINDGKSGLFRIELKGKIINSNVIKPRFPVNSGEFEKWEKRYLPAREAGILILSTSKGIMDHKKAKQLRIGGRLICFVY